MLIFHFLEKGLGIVSPPYFVYDFLRKMLFDFIVLTNQISLILEILGNMCTVFVCFPGRDMIKSEINQAVFLHDQKVETKV